MLRVSFGIAAVAWALCSIPAVAYAQPVEDPPEGDKPSTEEPSTEEPSTESPDEGADEDAASQGAEGVDPDTDPLENERERYFFLGLRFRDFIVPQFMINIFVDGGATVNAFSFGPELTTRKDGLELDFALSYVDMSFDPMLFKGKDDPIIKYEEVSSSMKMIQATVDVLFEVYATERSHFSILVGGGVGLGGVFGDLRENQIHPRDPARPDTEDVSQWRRCSGVNDPDVRDPDTGGSYCDNANEHFGDYTQPSWANGGSKPFIYPYLAFPQVSFRFKPIKQLQTRADLGFSFSNGFFLGMNAAYGF